MARALEVGIVGCGIAGTACALMLAGRGHAVTLFEQTPHVGPAGAGVLLQPSGQRVLADMKLLDALLPTVEPIEEIHAVTHRGPDLVRLRYGDLRPGLHGIGLHRGDLFTLLHGRLAAAGVRLHLGTPIVGMRSIDARPTLTDDQHRSHGPFDFVIAADGSRSRLRAACGVRGRVTEYPYGALWMVADCSPVRGHLFQAARGTEQLVGLLPVGGGRCSLFWGMRRDAVAGLRGRGFGRWRDDVLRLAPQAEPLVDRVGCLEACRFVTYRHVSVPRVWRGNVVFVGDAAHAMSPHLGQGVNLALQDAAALAAALDECGTPRAAFRRYAEARKWPTRYYAAVTALLTPFFQSRGSVLGWGRDAALPLMCGFGPTRRLMLRTLAGTGRT